MATLTSIKVDLQLMSQNFERKIQTVRQRINGIGQESSIATKRLQAMFGVATVAGFAAIVKGSLDSANRLSDLSNRLGTTAEGLSRLNYAANLTGVSTSTLEMGLQRMTRRVAEAANGTGEAVGALDELGLSASKLSQASPEEQFKILADALEQVPNQSDKVRLSMKLLDSEGVALLQTMKGGSKALNELGAESDRTGATISTKFAKQAEEANAAMKRVGATTTGLTNQLTTAMAPTLEAIANFMSSAMPVAIEWTSRAFNGLRAVIAAAIGGAIEALRTVTSNLAFISPTLANIDAKLYSVQESLYATAGGFANKVVEAASETAKLDINLKQSTKTFEDYTGRTESAAEATKKLADEQREAAAIKRDQEVVERDFEKIRTELLTEEQLINESYARRQESIAEFALLGDENTAIATQAAIETAAAHEEALLALKRATADEEIQIDRRKNSAINSQRSAATNTALGFFKTLTGGSKTAAKAILLVETALNVQRALQNTSAAAVRAVAELGPIAGPPAAAKITAWGNTQAGLIAAAGVLKLGASSGSSSAPSIGGGIGSTSTPAVATIPSSSTNSDNQKTETKIIFTGDFHGVDDRFIGQLAEKMSTFITDSDFIFLDSNSRNAQELIS